MSLYQTKILSTGMYTPKKVVTNYDLEKIVETSDAWITERTGIKKRHISSTEGGEFPSDMAYYASCEALKLAKLEPNDIDLILLATATPDVKLPNTASILQTKLGITNKCGCLDLSAACSGFVYALTVANALIQTGVVKTILVVGTEMLGREINWKDRSTCILFGDAAGAMILGQANPHDESRFLSSTLGCEGTGREFLEIPIGGAVTPLTKEHLDQDSHYIRMKGPDVFKLATRTMAQNAKKVIDSAGLELEEIDWMIPHQANIRIIETTGALLGIDPQKVIINIQNYGNTSSATIPMAFHEAILDGRIKRGQKIL